MSLGFYDIWLGQGVGNCAGFMNILKQRLTDNFVQNRRSHTENSSHTTFNRSIASFQYQPYLEIVNISKICNSISKLRMSSHSLEVEADRWVRFNRVPVNERNCVLCNVMEDEYHFVLECQRYIETRKKCIPKYC